MTTINKKEIEKFEKLALEWWNPSGKFKPLHILNPFRIEFIKEKIENHFELNQKSLLPLKKIKILDIGCGGGLLAEPITRLGAKVTGVDASKKNIMIAKSHAKKMNLKIDYKVGAVEELNFKYKFDVIMNMEVVEHVSNPKIFIKNCSKHLKKNGIMFVGTINRTLKSYMLAIIGAEYVLRWLPIGTHDWNKFITPNELQNLSKEYGLRSIETCGMEFSIVNSQWKRSKDNSVNYVSILKKI